MKLRERNYLVENNNEKPLSPVEKLMKDLFEDPDKLKNPVEAEKLVESKNAMLENSSAKSSKEEDILAEDKKNNSITQGDSKKEKLVSSKAKENENIHKNHRSRLKTQFLENGGSSLTDIQILELLLFFAIPQKDTNPLAHKLINKFGSLKNVLMADKNRLMTIDGIKENSATLITLVNSLFKFISKPNEGDVISSVLEAKKYCKNLFVGADVEQFYIICLSKGNMVKTVKAVQTGTSDEIAVQIRTITELAIESKCNRIIITHNHPFGSATMSDEDYSFTYSLICSCLLNSIDVVDHVIVGMDSVNSFAGQKLLNQLKNRAVKNINIPISSLKILSSYEEEYVIDDNH